jgi:hypothetical protein
VKTHSTFVVVDVSSDFSSRQTNRVIELLAFSRLLLRVTETFKQFISRRVGVFAASPLEWFHDSLCLWLSRSRHFTFRFAIERHWQAAKDKSRESTRNLAPTSRQSEPFRASPTIASYHCARIMNRDAEICCLRVGISRSIITFGARSKRSFRRGSLAATGASASRAPFMRSIKAKKRAKDKAEHKNGTERDKPV